KDAESGAYRALLCLTEQGLKAAAFVEQRAGIAVEHAADSQALIQLRQHYCERKDCLRCRFGSAYLRQ
ncbi:MAG: hypothetical protein U0K28_08440, partial [Prevotellamassilia sp.]|nr:hypothetical protein [Prevotellamassilia sp.]